MPKIIVRKKDWIKLGYKLFSQQGYSGIVVEKMSKKLKCNKSSFYWHFKTKKDFVKELIDFWVFTETEQIIYLTNIKKSATEKFDTLVALAYKKMPRQDFIFFLTRYAQTEKETKAMLDKIEKLRISYVAKLLMEIGYSDQEAKIKSALLYKHLIGYHEMIRYKTQSKNYMSEVKTELNEFINY